MGCNENRVVVEGDMHKVSGVKCPNELLIPRFGIVAHDRTSKCGWQEYVQNSRDHPTTARADPSHCTECDALRDARCVRSLQVLVGRSQTRTWTVNRVRILSWSQYEPVTYREARVTVTRRVTLDMLKSIHRPPRPSCGPCHGLLTREHHRCRQPEPRQQCWYLVVHARAPTGPS